MNTKNFYLSFDGSPNPPGTDLLLSTLDKHGVKASFFMEGRRLETEMECARRVLEAGHDVGNHSYNHPDFSKIPVEDCIREVDLTQNIIHKYLGITPKMLRPPGGIITEEVTDIFIEKGFDIVLWSYSVKDWEGPDAQSVAERILSQAVPGGIIACHDHVAWLTETLDIVIPALRAEGYSFKKISECGKTGIVRSGN